MLAFSTHSLSFSPISLCLLSFSAPNISKTEAFPKSKGPLLGLFEAVVQEAGKVPPDEEVLLGVVGTFVSRTEAVLFRFAWVDRPSEALLLRTASLHHHACPLLTGNWRVERNDEMLLTEGYPFLCAARQLLRVAYWLLGIPSCLRQKTR